MITPASEWKRHWPIVFSGAIGMAVTTVPFYTLGLLSDPLRREFGWSQTLITSGVTLNSLVGMCFIPLIGRLVDRWGPRSLALPGIVAYCLALWSFSTMTASSIHWWSSWLFTAVSILFLTPAVWVSAIAREFDRERGLAIAVVLTGTGVCAIVAPLGADWLLDRYGWRGAYTGLAAAVAIVSIPPLFLMFRPTKLTPMPSVKSAPARVDWQSTIRSAVFVRLLLGAVCVMFSVALIVLHFVPMVIERGLGKSAAAQAASLIGVGSIVGRLATGALFDRFDGRLVATLAFSVPLSAFALFLVPTFSVAQGMLCALLIGLALGAEYDVAAYLCSRYFPLECFGTVFGVVVAVTTAMTGLGPLAAAALHDRSGNYVLGLCAGAVICLLGVISVSTLPSSRAHICTPDTEEEPNR